MLSVCILSILNFHSLVEYCGTLCSNFHDAGTVQPGPILELLLLEVRSSISKSPGCNSSRETLAGYLLFGTASTIAEKDYLLPLLQKHLQEKEDRGFLHDRKRNETVPVRTTHMVPQELPTFKEMQKPQELLLHRSSKEEGRTGIVVRPCCDSQLRVIAGRPSKASTGSGQQLPSRGKLSIVKEAGSRCLIFFLVKGTPDLR